MKDRPIRKMVPINLIRQDADCQPRAHFDYQAAEEYGDALAEGTDFPPIILFFDGEWYWPGDGFHRTKGHELQDRPGILADVYEGTLADAQWYSCGANKTHGMRRTNEDKGRAIKRALMHPLAATLSDAAIAKHVGVSRPTVGEWRAKLKPTRKNSESNRKARKRKGLDGRTTDTTKCGKRAFRLKRRMKTEELRQGGKTLAEISRELSVSRERIRQYLLEAEPRCDRCGQLVPESHPAYRRHVEQRQRRAETVKREEDRQKVVRRVITMRSNGAPFRGIANELNLTLAQVAGICEYYGAPKKFSRKSWTPEQDSIALTNPMKIAAQLMERSAASVYSRLQQIDKKRREMV